MGRYDPARFSALKLLYRLALLVCDRAGGLASGLAGTLAFAASAFFGACFKACLIDRNNMLQFTHLF